MIIRRLSSPGWEDYRAIRLRALEDAPEAFGAVLGAEAALPEAAFAARLKGAVVMAAYEAELIVGMAGYKRAAGLKDAHKARVWGMFVEPSFRGRGIGAALMLALMEAARGEEIEQLTLAVVADNRAARSLYERLGFTGYGVEPRALKTIHGYADEVLMLRFL